MSNFVKNGALECRGLLVKPLCTSYKTAPFLSRHYVYLQYVDDRFKSYYAPLFEDKDTIDNNRLFRIVDRDGELRLKFIS